MSSAPLQSLVKKRIVISVDFGTSRSGFSISLFGDKDRKIVTETAWPDSQDSQYCKTLTQILYDADKNPVSWGYTAVEQMADAEEEGSVDHHLLKYFKMYLHDPNGTTFKDRNKEFEVHQVIVDYLKYLYEYIMEFVAKLNGGKKPSISEIKWCLTIPAIWDEKAKSFMRKVAYDVGMIETENATEEEFMLILEPEAAAVYCLDEMCSKAPQSLENKRFLIVDAGGGTVDLTAHLVEKGKLRELSKGSGGPCGASYVDENFWTFLGKAFGKKNIDNFRHENAVSAVSLMTEWEKVKTNVQSFDSTKFISVSQEFIDMVQVSKVTTPFFNSASRKIKIPGEQLKEIFMPVLEKVVELVGNQLDEVQTNTKSSIDFIFIVGGFGQSRVLQDAIRNELGNRVSNVVVPPKPGNAVVCGATLLGLDPSFIRTRRVRFTCGVKAFVKFDPSQHSSDKKYYDSEKNNYLCQDYFDKFVKTNDEVEVNAKVTREYNVIHSSQQSMSIQVYSSLFADRMYVDDKSVKKLAELSIDLSKTSGGIDRSVIVNMFFGKSEIKVEAFDSKNTNNVLATELKFKESQVYEGESKVETMSTNYPQTKYHISGSMGSGDAVPSLPFLQHMRCRIGALYESCYDFLKLREGGEDIVSMIVYESRAQILFNNVPCSASIIEKYCKGCGPSGGTNYKHPMELAYQVVQGNKPGYTPIILFMTDGNNHEDGAEQVLRNIMSSFEFTGVSLHAIQISNNSGANTSLLKKYAEIGKGQFHYSSANAISMKKTYANIAGLLKQ